MSTEDTNDLAPLNRIRVETVLSRYPIHRLAKKGTVAIDLEGGDNNLTWEVTYNSKHGQPGPLAYKLDTLIVNQRIDELGRPLPELIKIGSLSDICRALGSHTNGGNIADIKRAFLQNAFTAITAKIRGKTKSGKEKWFEIGYTRYSVVFTGEALPNGTEADAVYIMLNPPYRDLLNHVETRPLDYNYLKKLPPGPQRFYELLSFRIYGAIAGSRPRAKMLYSEYCKYAPQMRYADFDHVKKQMYKLHVLHRKAGYISKVEYQQTTDARGSGDWEMFYTPGPKAFAEYRAFTNRQLPQVPSQALHTEKTGKGTAAQATLDLATPDEAALLTELTRRGITEAKARALSAGLAPGQPVLDQLAYVDTLIAQAPHGKIRNPAGFYVRFIEDNTQVPSDFRPRTSRLRDNAAEAYEHHCNQEIGRFILDLPRNEYLTIIERHSVETRHAFPKMAPMEIEQIAQAALRVEIRESGRVKLPTLEEFRRSR